MTFEERINAIRLTVPSKSDFESNKRIFDEVLGLLMTGLGIEAELIATYSAEKMPRLESFNGRKYLVADEALNETFLYLNSLSKIEGNPDITIAALQRALAEACRKKGNIRLYAFFISRALEVKNVFSSLLRGGQSRHDRFWQTIIPMAHEAAHAIPVETELGECILLETQIEISKQTNGIIQRTSIELVKALNTIDEGADLIDEPLQSKWTQLLAALESPEEVIQKSFLGKIRSPGFKNEIYCDFFSCSVLTDYIKQYLAKPKPTISANEIQTIFESAYAAFLNMRFLSYVDHLCENIDQQHLTDDYLIPWEIDGLVEFSIRGNLVRDKLISSSKEVFSSAGLEYDNQMLQSQLKDLADRHTESLFVPLNTFFENYLFTRRFQDDVDSSFRQLGYDTEDKAWKKSPKLRKWADGLWKKMVS